eukprot:TRINITY_DN2973_c1_g1_i1.p1 TRINITY_DN2973_c1_g1~~TRINITY_DN2973_c1_g1_i1.p1  ORF type:complete len:167 (-),score=8.91 TRINITY_DN2973_c1_g1_i1:102-602(-)
MGYFGPHQSKKDIASTNAPSHYCVHPQERKQTRPGVVWVDNFVIIDELYPVATRTVHRFTEFCNFYNMRLVAKECKHIFYQPSGETPKPSGITFTDLELQRRISTREDILGRKIQEWKPWRRAFPLHIRIAAKFLEEGNATIKEQTATRYANMTIPIHCEISTLGS